MNVKKSILIVLAIVSLFLYWAAPKAYSLTHCYLCFALFVVSFIILFQQRIRKNLISFEFIFSFAYFFTNYIFPLVVYNINANFALFRLGYPEEYINKGIALTTIGYVMFTIGVIKYPVIECINDNNRKNEFYSPWFYKPISVLLLLLLIYNLIPILLSGVYDGNYGEGTFIKAVSDYFVFYLIYEKFSNSNHSILSFIKNNTFFVVLVLIYLLEITMIGNRGMLMRIALLSVLCFDTFYKKIKTRHFVIMMVAGMILLYLVGIVRGGGDIQNASNEEIPAVVLVGKDFFINNRSLYVLMEYTDIHGLSFGKTSALDFAAIIPFGQSVLLNLTGLRVGDMNSASLVTDLYYDFSNEEMIGLGTNLIGDIYLSFGLMGVIVLMFVLGRFVSYSNYKGMNGDLKWLFVYAILLMNSLIYVRSTYFGLLRPIIWCLALYYISRVSIKHKSVVGHCSNKDIGKNNAQISSN